MKSLAILSVLFAANESVHWFLKPEWVMVWVTIAYVLIAAFTLFAIWRQANIMQQQAKAMVAQAGLMEDTAKRQLRAYLCVDEACVKITENANIEGQVYRMLEGQLHIKNGGQTPAYGVRSWIHGSIRPYPESTPVPPPPEGMPRSTEIIPAQGKRIFIAKEIGESPQIMENLKSPNIAYYVQGEVRYRDIFKDWHCLKIRMFFGGPAGTRTTKDAKGVTLGYLVADSWGNSGEDETQPDDQQ
jgi:hypothetical protein